MSNEMTTDNMSNEEVIEVLKGLVFNSFDRTTSKERQALDHAIKSLEERPQGDLISRDALKKVLCEEYEAREHYIGEKMLEAIDNAPPVKFSLLPLAGDCDEAYMRGYNHGKAEGILKAHTRPKGEWIPIKQRDNTHIWVCSECGNQNRHGITVEKACWKCGADMRGGAE